MTGRISVEDLTGDTQEIELVHYYKLRDFGQLLAAAKIVEQEQWEMKSPKTNLNKTGGKIRVRKSRGRGVPEWTYTLTTKLKEDGVVGERESTREIDEVLFESIKAMCNNGMFKLRCTFPIPGTANTWPAGTNEFNDALCWEVDVFPPVPGATDADSSAPGKFFGWVKVDLESPQVLESVPEFPLAFERAITEQYGQRSEEDEALVSSWYQTAFIYTHEKDQARLGALEAAEGQPDEQGSAETVVGGEEPGADGETPAETPDTATPTEQPETPETQQENGKAGDDVELAPTEGEPKEEPEATEGEAKEEEPAEAKDPEDSGEPTGKGNEADDAKGGSK